MKVTSINLTKLNIVSQVRYWLESKEICSSRLAHCLCKLIPARCPFEREIKLLNRTIHIPPLCKLNPLYNQIVELRFKSLTYLVNSGEDISLYC